MLPLKIENKAFITYENKVEYILEWLNVNKLILKDSVDALIKYSAQEDRQQTANKYINKLSYLKSEEAIKAINSLKNQGLMEKLTAEILICFLKEKSKMMEDELLKKHNIDYKNIVFIENNDKTLVKINEHSYNVNKCDGQVYMIFYKNLILKENHITKIADLIGMSIERSSRDGIANRRIQAGNESL